MLDLSIYPHTDYQIGIGLWADGKLVSFAELLTSAKSQKNAIIHYKVSLDKALREYEERRNDSWNLAAIEIPEDVGGLQKMAAFIRQVEDIIRPFFKQILPTTSPSNFLDRAISTVRSFNRPANPYVVGAVCCGLAAGFGNNMDFTSPIASFTNLLEASSVANDPGILEQISEMGLKIYSKSCSDEPITQEDLLRAASLSAFAELVDMPEEAKLKIRKFADRLDKIHGRLQGDKKIELAPVKQAQDDLKFIMKRLEELENIG